MTQSFKDIATTDFIDTGLLDLLARDMTALTAMSGDSDPSSPPTDAIYDNTTAGVIKLNGNTFIDYRNGLLTSTILTSLYQPLNSILTAISGASISTDCLITTNGEVVPVDNYGLSAAIDTEVDGAGSISKRTIIATSDIDNGSITATKLAGAISTTPVFNPGDVLFSLNTTPRQGFLRLAEGYSVGSSTSSATYAGNSYYNLYEVLWANQNALLRDSLGNITTRGSSASDDFASNKSVELPYAKKPGARFDYTGSVQTYTVPEGVHYLTIECVGAAGGAGCFGWPAAGVEYIYSGKAKGGYVKGVMKVTPGETLYIYVGGEGKSAPDPWPPLVDTSYTSLPGGYNGGGAGAIQAYYGYYSYGSGGGMTDIRTSTNVESQILVAGGGGGSFLVFDWNTRQGTTVYGGSQNTRGDMLNQGPSSMPGIPGTPGQSPGRGAFYSNSNNRSGDGARGQGGSGFTSAWGLCGTGGGGGYYGGGGGQTGTQNNVQYYLGAAGGNSWVDTSRLSAREYTAINDYPDATGNGWVTITAGGRFDATQVTTYIKY